MDGWMDGRKRKREEVVVSRCKCEEKSEKGRELKRVPCSFIG
jgi:hypothetical protein